MILNLFLAQKLEGWEAGGGGGGGGEGGVVALCLKSGM